MFSWSRLYLGRVLAAAVIFFLIVPIPASILDIALIVTMFSIVVILFMSVIAIAIGNGRMAVMFEKIVNCVLCLNILFCTIASRLFFSRGDFGNVLDAFGNYVVQGDVLQGWYIWLFCCAVTFGLILAGRYLEKKMPQGVPNNSLWFLVSIIAFVLLNLFGFILMNLFIAHSDANTYELFVFASRKVIGLGSFFNVVAFWLSIATLLLIGAMKRSRIQK